MQRLTVRLTVPLERLADSRTEIRSKASKLIELSRILQFLL